MRFDENTRVKVPATAHFMRLGYEYQSLAHASIDENTNIFINRFKLAIERINGRSFTDVEVEVILKEIHSTLLNHDLGREFYWWLKLPGERVRLIDFDNIENNDFAVCNELIFPVAGRKDLKDSFRPDISILINGIPLGFIEVKPPNNEGGIQQEFKRMIDKRLEVPSHEKFFNMLQLVCFSNNMEYENVDDSAPAEDVKAGSFYTTPNKGKTTFSFFREEESARTLMLQPVTQKQIEGILSDNGYAAAEYSKAEFQTNLKETSPCNAFISSLFDKERLMFLLQYGIMFVKTKVPEKHIMRYPQFFAARQIIKRLETGSKAGIIWHTQGSGKTALAAFANPIIRDYYAAKGITARFFFVVDRLDLLRQASDEFAVRDFHVTKAENREQFMPELNRPLATAISMNAIGEFCCVNIQKFSNEIPEAVNDYESKVQRIFFIDEAHRSYKNTGEFFKNLMLADRDAIYIALTGTPLLSKRERSNLKFGDYIHRYFYDKSIADGYTLRIKRENIDTVAKTEIRRNLQLEDPSTDKRFVMESPDYINALCKFVETDFENFRIQNADNTIGGMIVCSSTTQAKMVHQWFFENAKNLVTGLVITDVENPTQAATNKTNQLSFRNDGYPDILVVHQMLTTGYDVKRLKKMYLLRNAKEHTLLQTISRVNRPYHAPNGRYYQYGYITDFIDIEEEYDRTINQYIKELEDGMDSDGEEEGSLAGLVVSVDDIWEKYERYKDSLLEIVFDITNMEKFVKTVNRFNKETLLSIRRLLNAMKECHTEFLISRAHDKAKKVDIKRLNILIKETQRRIDFINLKNRPSEVLNILSNKAVVEILYEFIKTKVSIINLGLLHGASEYTKQIQDFLDVVSLIQEEVKQSKNPKQTELIALDEYLSRLFEQLEISSLTELEGITDELRTMYEKYKAINAENERLAQRFEGNFAYVATYQGLLQANPSLDKEEVITLMGVIYDTAKELTGRNTLIMHNRDNFITGIKKNIVVQLVKSGLFKKMQLSKQLDAVLSDTYKNLLVYR